jgi:hypothetical protein
MMDMFLFFSVAARGVHAQREENGERRAAEGGERGERGEKRRAKSVISGRERP